MQILIAGIRGFLGSALAHHLTMQGHSVTGISRKSSKNILSWDEFEKIDTLTYQAVINLCGEPLLGKRWSEAYKEKLRSSRLAPTACIIQKIESSQVKPKVLIQGSAIGFYPSDKGPYTEGDGPGNNFLSELCQDWEKASKPGDHSWRSVLLRTGIVLSQDSKAYRQLRRPFLLGLGGIVGTGQQVIPWIHLEDFCRLVSWAIEDETLSGPLNATAPVRTNQEAFAHALATTLHSKVRTKIPRWIIQAALGQASSLILEGSEITPQKALEHGFEFKFHSLKKALCALEEIDDSGVEY